MGAKPKIVWVSSWDRVCGIADYSKALYPVIKKRWSNDFDFELISIDEFQSKKGLFEALLKAKPSLIHFQHEYGLFGGKNPPFYIFPSLVKELKDRQIVLMATAHTVLDPQYRFPVVGNAIQKSVRFLLNQPRVLSRLQQGWGPQTWSGLDAVVVHSALQVQSVKQAGCPRVQVIPHFIFDAQQGVQGTVSRGSRGARSSTHSKKRIVVFGFFSHGKGQDLVLDAVRILKKEGLFLKENFPQFIFAGGVRRSGDRGYFDDCVDQIKQEDLGVEVTGYLDSKKVETYLRSADLVLAPFRETTGSGSLAQALARGLAVLASDLPLNLEVSQRIVEGDPAPTPCLEFFKSGDAGDLARKIHALLVDENKLLELRKGAKKYALKYGLIPTADATIELAIDLLGAQHAKTHRN